MAARPRLTAGRRKRHYGIIDRLGGPADPRRAIPDQVAAARILTATLAGEIVGDDLAPGGKRALFDYLDFLISDNCDDMAETPKLMATHAQKGGPKGPPAGRRGSPAP